jgi:hypothetical protein
VVGHTFVFGQPVFEAAHNLAGAPGRAKGSNPESIATCGAELALR